MVKDNSIDIKLKSLEAFLLSKEKGVDEGIAAISEYSEPDMVRRKLSILLDSEQFDRTVSLISDLPLHERWCDKAVYACVRNGNIGRAKEIIEWTQTVDDEPLRNRCRLFYADARYIRAWRNRKKGEVIAPGELSNEEKDELNDAIELLGPILAKVIAEKRVFNEIESLALQIAVRINHLFSDIQKVRNLSILLLSREPIPLEVGRIALNRLITIPANVPERLRKEHSDSFEAQLLASLLESEIFGQHRDAYQNIKRSACMAQNKEQKLDFCKVLYQIVQGLGKKELNEVEEICINYFGKDHRVVSLIQADIFIREKELDKAHEYLMKAMDENDPTWLQIYAQYLHLMGKRPEALEYMNRARLILPHPELLKSTAKLAFETENYDLSIELLKQELNTEADNISLLNNIAAAFFRKGDYKSAAEYFEKLKGLRTEELSYHLNLATCYAQIGDPQKAIKTYDEVCNRSDAPLDAFLSRAYLIRINDPVKAFDSILPLKDKYWENPQYLQVVLDLSYRAGKEEYGHQAMLKLLELQRQGKAPQEILQAKTIEDLKVHMNEWNKRVELVNKNILTGKIPWLMSDHWQNHTAYMGWCIRTQPLAWRIEEPLNCASLSIYSTNSFSVVKLSDDTTKLDFIECPPKDTDIAVDLSAIITLHRLGLLEACLKYFKIHIPKEYPAIFLRDSDNLVIHQRTKKTSAEAIKKTIDNGQIIILEDVGSVGDRPFPFVHEHTLPEKEEEHYYRLIDMIQIAYGTGRLNEEQYNVLKNIAHKPSGIDQEHPGLKHGQSIYVDIHTLYSICQTDIESLVPILNTFRIYISKADQLRNSGETIQIETQEQLKSWNDQLLQLIRDKDEFIKEAHNPVPELKEDNVYLASCWIAKGKSLPLLADDRVLQVLAINENKSIEHPSFGTDRLLLKLFEENSIDIETLSNAFLSLMKWRYRFIVPTKNILVYLAKRYKKHPPGQDLQEVALYLHDCMRDPGLFAGPENTTLKETMAARLYATWTRTTTEFLAGVWADSQFSEESARKITEWVLKEFSPSLPKNIISDKLHMLEVLPKAIFDYFLALIFNIDDTSRANKALQAIAEGLNMSETEYFKAVSEVVDKYGI